MINNHIKHLIIFLGNKVFALLSIILHTTDVPFYTSWLTRSIMIYERVKDPWTQTAPWKHMVDASLTLSQWFSSGLPVAIQCAWNLDPSVHWNATGERIVGSQCVSSVFQWSSSGFPVVFQCVPIMQINTGSPLGYHWVLASASVVPVASQCTCGSSGLPVCSNYAN